MLFKFSCFSPFFIGFPPLLNISKENNLPTTTSESLSDMKYIYIKNKQTKKKNTYNLKPYSLYHLESITEQ